LNFGVKPKLIHKVKWYWSSVLRFSGRVWFWTEFKTELFQ